MRTSEYDGVPLSEPRSHPWSAARDNSANRYWDFRTTPALIRTCLEDFLPWAQYPAIERFFVLLEWLNGSASLLESNDCEFTGPELNEHLAVAKSQQCSGRVMLLFRALGRNTLAGEIERFSTQLHRELAQLDPDFEYGLVATTRVPVRYLALQAAGQESLGAELMLSFWTWGNDASETLENLNRLMSNLSLGLHRASVSL